MLDPLSVAGTLCLSAIVGSFIGLVVVRWPQGRGVVTGRSCCDACGNVLGAAELVPVVSYVACGGRCRRCGARIAVDQLLAELGAMTAGLLAICAASNMAAAALLMLCSWVLLTLALLDWRHLWLPDALTLPLMLLGLLSAAVLPSPGLGERLAGLCLGYGFLEVLRRGYRRLRGRVVMGAGDPKLLGATGAWAGIAPLPWIVLLAAALCFIGLSIARLRHQPRPDRLPLGTGLAIAAMLLVPLISGG